MREALQRACEIAGGQTALARAIGRRQGDIWYWLKRGYPSAEYVLAIEEATGVKRTELRPDIYPERAA